MEEVGLQDVGYRERQDLQRWVEAYPEIVGPDLLLVTAELDRWRFGGDRVLDRLDLLFLTADGTPLVAELKRGEAPDTVDMQALKYAAYCSQLTVDDVVDAYRRYRGVGPEEARSDVFEHAPSLTEEGLLPVRVRLVAEGLRPSVTTTVMWMYQELGLDIGCVKITAKRLPDGSAVVASRLILPPPAAEDYMVGIRRRDDREEERLQRTSSGRRPNAVSRLLAAGSIPEGAELALRVWQLTREEQRLVEPLLEEDEAAGIAEWTGTSLTKALRWRKDGELYSASRLVTKVLQLCGARPESDPGSAPGPIFWEDADGRSLYELSEALVGAETGDGAREGEEGER